MQIDRAILTKRTPNTPFAAVSLQPESPLPLYQQLYDELRAAILSGRLAAGTRLPSTRTLADQLAISRNTVMSAFDQLMAEGYIESGVGDGTYVSRSLPDESLTADSHRRNTPLSISKGRTLSRRGKLLATTAVTATGGQNQHRAFRSGPALVDFPFDIWARLEAHFWRQPPPIALTYGDPAGYKPLRQAISDYLRAARAVRCEPEQVIIVSGSQQALDLTGRVLLDPGDSVWFEDPGYVGARGALIAAGANLLPVPLDDEGLDLDEAIRRSGKTAVRMVYVSPSHQYPLGITMSLTRRLALLDWANRAGAWILEDDYDSEYRYASRPLAALQGLDQENRVIYLGTFSKDMFPALRIGYLVAPPDLVDAFISARALADRHSPTPTQAVLAEFILEGHFVRHIRRMRKLYSERQEVLVTAAKHHLDGLLDIPPADAGLYLNGWLPQGISDEDAARKALAHDVEVSPLSAYCIEPYERSGLLLGYAAYNEQEIQDGVRRLAQALASGLS
jgi:GntR family transcriptional regulator/MocR family aminotransferase